MDKRTLLALVLAAAVIVVVQLLFPTPSSRLLRVKTTTHLADSSLDGNRLRPVRPSVTDTTAIGTSSSSHSRAAMVLPLVVAETSIVKLGAVSYALTSRGATPLFVSLPDSAYPNLRSQGKAQRLLGIRQTGAVLAQLHAPLVSYEVIVGGDTLVLDTMVFHVGRVENAVTYNSANSSGIDIAYSPTSRPYVVHVQGSVGAPHATQLLVDLPGTLRSQEADTLDDLRHLAYVYKRVHDDVRSTPFSKLDSMMVRTDSGPLQWAAVRDKYFLLALIAPASARFRSIRMRGGSSVNKIAVAAHASVSLPLTTGVFQFDLYAGPQSMGQLQKVGSEFENVNPYAGWLHGVVQPFVTIVMRVLLWMKRTLRINYGWVLAIFAVFIRLLMWPLNQSAMRSSMKMQRLQPEMTEIQRRYKTDPEKQREATVKLYHDHGMSPFSPMMGCLPMLLTMPVLYALYFVFQNTIEFRGVSFLWLPDLSLRDPFYITPLFMGASMFVLSWIGMRGIPPTPQSKTMAYMMPVMFTVMFFRFPSGLNLYYAVQNIAALPQQFAISRERKKSNAGKTLSPPRPST